MGNSNDFCLRKEDIVNAQLDLLKCRMGSLCFFQWRRISNVSFTITVNVTVLYFRQNKAFNSELVLWHLQPVTQSNLFSLESRENNYFDRNAWGPVVVKIAFIIFVHLFSSVLELFL